MNWPAHQAEITELLSIDNWDKAVAWVEEHPEVVADGYMFSKECVQIFTMQAAKGMLANGVRIASACPAPIDTPLLPDFKKTMGEGMIDWTAANAGGRYVTAAEVANLLAYLGSDAASFVSGVNVNIDNAFQGRLITRPGRLRRMAASALATAAKRRPPTSLKLGGVGRYLSATSPSTLASSPSASSGAPPGPAWGAISPVRILPTAHSAMGPWAVSSKGMMWFRPPPRWL